MRVTQHHAIPIEALLSDAEKNAKRVRCLPSELTPAEIDAQAQRDVIELTLQLFKEKFLTEVSANG